MKSIIKEMKSRLHGKALNANLGTWTEQQVAAFVACRFYLDIKEASTKAYIMKQLSRVGGKIEEFLSKRIDYIVTDRAESSLLLQHSTSHCGISAIQLCGNLAPSSPASCRGRFFDSHLLNPMPKNTANRSMKIISLSQNAAKHQNKGTTNLVEVARNWGICVVNTKVILSVLKAYKGSHAKENCRPHVKRKLQEHFIKIEDKDAYYRPLYKEFKEWPEVPSSKVSDFKPSRQPKQDWQIKMPLRPLNHTQLSSKMKTVNGCSTATASVVQGKNKQEVHYCEICGTSFNNLQMHVATATHKSYMENSLNYEEVATVMTSCPHLSFEDNASSCVNTGSTKAPLGSAETAILCNVPSSCGVIRRLDESVRANKSFLSIHDWPLTIPSEPPESSLSSAKMSEERIEGSCESGSSNLLGYINNVGTKMCMSRNKKEIVEEEQSTLCSEQHSYRTRIGSFLQQNVLEEPLDLSISPSFHEEDSTSKELVLTDYTGTTEEFGLEQIKSDCFDLIHNFANPSLKAT